MRADGFSLAFCVTQEPQAGESVIGFFSRTLAETPVRNFRAALKLAGISAETSKVVDFGLSHCDRAKLSALLDVETDQLLAMVGRRLRPSASSLRFNAVRMRQFRRSLAMRGQRRVGVRALCENAYHRESWDNPLITFDPETLDMLESICPGCHRPLGWRRAVRPYFCDRCLDERGLPFVDLREVKPRPYPFSDPAIGRLIGDLLMPWSKQAVDRISDSLPKEFHRYPTASICQVFTTLAESIEFHSHAPFEHKKGPLSSKSLETAARAFGEGMTKVAWTFHRYLPSEPYFDRAVAQVPGFESEKIWRSLRARFIPKSAQKLGSSKIAVDPPRGRKRYGGSLSGAADVHGHDDTQIARVVQDILGICGSDIERLIDSGDIKTSKDLSLKYVLDRHFISARSLMAFMDLVERTDSRVFDTRPTPSLMSIRQFCAAHKSIAVSDVMRGLAHSRIPRFTCRSMSPCWQDTLHIADEEGLLHAIRTVKQASKWQFMRVGH